jgi:uncharacterized protein
VSTKYVLLYESADDVVSKVPLHFAAHEARGREFHDRGLLLMYGPFGDPQEQGSMAAAAPPVAASVYAERAHRFIARRAQPYRERPAPGAAFGG